MLIPVVCVSCGKLLADKYRYYERKCKEIEERETKEFEKNGKTPMNVAGPNGLIGPGTAHVLDEMGIHRMCCRRHMISNIDAMARI